MTDHRIVEAYCPVWLKTLSCLGIPTLTAIGLWLISRPLWDKGITPLQYVAGLAMGAAVLYQCSIGWLTLKYINTRIIAFDDRLLIQSKGTEQTVFWEDIAPAKEYSFATATRLSHKSGQTIIYAFNNMTGFYIIKSLLNKEHEETEIDH